MKVKELRRKLKGVNPNSEVIIGWEPPNPTILQEGPAYGKVDIVSKLSQTDTETVCIITTFNFKERIGEVV